MTDSNIIPTWTFADRLRKSRETAGLTQQDMAELILKKRTAISSWEKGKHRPDDLTIRAWAVYTKVPVEWLEHGVVSGPNDGEGVTIGKPRPVTHLDLWRQAASGVPPGQSLDLAS